MGSLTFSMLNAWVVDPLVEWMQEHVGFVYANMVNNPAYLAVHIAPDHVKQAILNHVQHHELRGYLQLQPHNPDLWRQFLIWTKRQDLYRKQNFKDAFPEYFQVIQNEWDQVTDLSEQNFNRQTQSA
jgi:hypothetical protein